MTSEDTRCHVFMPVHLLVDRWGTLGFVCGPCPGLYQQRLDPIHCQQHKDGLRIKRPFKGALSLHTVTFWCWGLGGREMEVLYVSPMCPLIITPFCTQCYAVEHENKNTLPSSQPSVQTPISEWVAPNTSVLSVLLPHQLWRFAFTAHHCHCMFVSAPWVRTKRVRFIEYERSDDKPSNSPVWGPKHLKYPTLKLR